MEHLSRLEIVQLWIQNEQTYIYNLHLNRNFYNEDELLNQRIIAKLFNRKQTEYFFAIKELEIIELKIKSCINLQELEQLILQRDNLMKIINFHIRIPSSLKCSLEEILFYIDKIEDFSKKYYYL